MNWKTQVFAYDHLKFASNKLEWYGVDAMSELGSRARPKRHR
jgi:hypothetical protein